MKYDALIASYLSVLPVLDRRADEAAKRAQDVRDEIARLRELQSQLPDDGPAWAS